MTTISEPALAQVPNFTTSPTTTLSFGNQMVGGTSAPKTVTITAGTSGLTFALTVPPDYTATSACINNVVPASGTCAISVRFVPTVTGSRPGTLTITDTGNALNKRSITLSGTGVLASSISPSTLPFGSVVQHTTSAGKTFKLTNNQDVQLTNILLTSNNPDYTVSGCPVTLNSRTSCTATVKFTPTRAPTAADNGRILITHSAATSPQSVALTGTSVFPMALSTATVTVSSTIIGFTKTATLTLKNNQKVSLSAITLTPNGPFTATGCGGTYTPGQSCTITITFAPLANHLGAVTGGLLVVSTNPTAWNRPTAVLKGTGAPQMTVTPTPLSFGSLGVAVTGAAKTITIKNNRPVGSAALTFLAPKFSFAGANPGDFAQTTTTCGATLAAGASCTAALTFKPTQDGPRAADVQVNTNALGSPYKTSLTGTGTTPITVTPSKVSFTTTNVGDVSPGKLVTLKNNQNVAVTLGAMNAGGDFAKQDTATTLTTCGVTLAAGASCDVSLVFKPTAGGGRNGTLPIPNNTSSVLGVPLSGTGAKAVTAAPTTVPFGSQKVGTTSLSKQIALTNHQSVPSDLGPIVSANYASTDACGGRIPALSTCVVSVTFSPTVTGSKSGTITFNNPGGSRVSVALSGSGTNTDPAAAIATIAPGAGTRGTSVPNVVVTGNGYTRFAANSAVNFGAGITVSNLRNVSANSLTVDLAIAAAATTGGRTVTVTTPLAGGGTEVASSAASAFVVSGSGGGAISIAPAAGIQGQAVNVAIVGTGTDFQNGVTTANFGEGVFLNGAVSVQDATHALVNVTVSPTASVGWRAVTLVTGGSYATLTPSGGGGPGFQVLKSNAALTALSQASAAQGATALAVTVTGANTHFVSGATQLSFGNGITVSGVTAINATQLSATLTINAAATPGVRSVVATTGGEVARLDGAFTVTPTNATPHLASVSPASARQGESLTVTLLGVNTDFDGQSPSLSLGGNIAIQPLTVVNDTRITANITVDLLAAIGIRDAILSSGGIDHHFTFAVTGSSASITTVAPGVGAQGTQISTTVTGLNTHWDQNTTSAWFSSVPGCATPHIVRTQVANATSLALDLDLPANGCTGPLTFQVVTGGEIVSGTFGVYAQTPSLSLSPSTAMAGSTVTVNFVGEFSHFSGNAPTTVAIDGAKVAISGFAVLSPTSAKATFTIAPDALTGGCFPVAQSGCHTVTVTTPLINGSEILAAKFHVTTTPAVLTRIEPFHAPPGVTVPVRIYGSYTHFATGLTTLGFGADTSVNNLTIVSPQELTANVTIGNAAALGYRSAYVNTGSEQLAIGFRIDGPASPTIVSVSPSNARQGQSLTVAITGANTHFDGNSQLILGAGVTVAQFTVTGPTAATAVIDVSPTAPVGPNTVVVITPSPTGDEVVSALGFSVERGIQNVKFVKRASDPDPAPPPPAVIAAQSQTLNVAIAGEGTHWLQGGTTADFGPGVIVSQLAVQDPTHATAQITVLANAPLGFHVAGMTTGGEYVTLSQALNIQQSTPALVISSPNAGGQGTTFNVQVVATQTHWQQGVTTASYGPDVVVNSFTVLDSATAMMNVTVTPLAYPGLCHSLTVTTGTEQVSLPNQLCVVSGPARVLSVTPSLVPQQDSVAVQVVGHATHFVQGVTTADFGPGIGVNFVTVTSPTTASLSISVPGTAPTGFHTVTMRTHGEAASQTFAFVVGATVATLNGASPTTAQQGQQNVSIRLIGQNTHWTNGITTASFGQGVLVSGVSVINATTLDAIISVDALAALGGRTVTVVTGGEIVSAAIFSVLGGGAIITDSSPDSGNQGQDIVLTITGQNTLWSQGQTQFSIAGAGGDIKINYVLINSPTSATAEITISPTAQLGGRSIYMITGTQTLVNANAFIVTGGVPAVASVSPGSAIQGQNGINVQIQGLHTEWLTGTTTVDFGPGVTVQSRTLNNDTSITAVVDIAAAAALGGRKVTVRNVRAGSSPQVLEGHFEVLSSTPPPALLSYMSPTTGLRGQTLAIAFSGRYTHWTPASTTLEIGEGASGITINAFQVTGPTSAIASISIAANAPIAQQTVLIETGTELVQGAFNVVQAVPVLTVVDPGAGMQGALMAVNILGRYTAFDATTSFDFGAGITVQSVEVLGPTIARVTIKIGDLAPQGIHGVTSTTAGVVLGGGAFYVTPSQAVIVSVTPNTAKQNDVLSVQLTGQNTNWSASTTFNFGGGVNVTSQQVFDATHAEVSITLDPLAGLGARSVTATTIGEIATMVNAFIVQPGTPLVLSSAPVSGLQQQNVTLTILGQFTSWVQGQTTLSVGNGVTVTSVSVTSPTSITAQAKIEWFAAVGSRTVTVTTGAQSLVLPGALSVGYGPAAISQVVPNQAGQNAAANVVVTGVNTHFTQNTTSANFGQGITINGVQVTSPTSATVAVSVLGGAIPGLRNVTLSTQGEVATIENAFTVQQTVGVLQFVKPASRPQSSTGAVKVIGAITNFTAATVFNFGPGVTVNSHTVISAVEADVTITISPLAARTTRNVTATTAGVTVTGLNLFTVSAGPAFLSSVAPNNGRQNQSGLQVTITGNGTHFTATTPTVSLGSGVTVTNIQVTSDTLLTTTVNIAASAPVQLNDVSVTTSGELALFPGGFEVRAGTPIVNTVTPSTAKQNQTRDVVVTGLYTSFLQGTTTASFGAGIVVNQVTVTTQTLATVNITVQPTAALGARTVTMTTGTQVATGAGVFTVQVGDPQVTALTPNSGHQNTTQTVTIDALYTHFQAGVSQVAFSGTGVSAGAVTVVNATQIQVPVTVQLGATPGTRTVTVTTGAEVASLVGGFTVQSSPPAITIIDSNVGAPNSTINVSITGEFTSFVNGVTQAKFGPGISVNGAAANAFGTITVTGPTSAVAALNISAGATLGPRDVTVKTGTEVLVVNAGFTVQTAPVPAPVVTMVSPVSTATDVPTNTEITIQFSAPLNRNTVSIANIRLMDPVGLGGCGTSYVISRPGTVSVDASGRLVTFTPSSVLAVGRQYEVCVNYGQNSTPQAIKDPAGNEVPYYMYSFKTGFGPDTTGPSFIAANIANGDVTVPINAPVMLGFTRPIDPTTVPVGVSITTGGVAVPGTFGYTQNYKQLIFTPASPLAAGTSYVVSYSGALEDAVGNPLVNPGSLSFTTSTVTDTATPVMVSYSPNTTTAALNTIVRVVFDEPLNPLRSDAGSLVLTNLNTGWVVTGTTTVLSPDRRTLTLQATRPLDPGTSYQWAVNYAWDRVGNAAGFAVGFRTATSNDVTPPVVTGRSPGSGASGVPINAKIQVLFDEPVARTATPVFTLSPPVAGNLVLTTDNLSYLFTPAVPLAPSTVYSVNLSGVSDGSGNPAAAAIWSFTTAASATPDTTNGTITMVPASAATGIAPTAPIVLSFSEPINPASLVPQTVRIYDGTAGQDVPGTWSLSANAQTLTFTPTPGYGSLHQICVYASYYVAIFDRAGNYFNSLGGQCFTTGSTTDSVPPQVISVMPVNGATGIGPANPITVTFSEPLLVTTLSATGNVALYRGSTMVTNATVAADGRSVTFNPTLEYGATYTVVITPYVKDLAGNALPQQFTSTFTVAPRPATARPQVVAFRPGSGASGVAPATPVTFFLSLPIDAATLNGALFVAQNGVLVPGAVTVGGSNRVITFTPSAPLEPGALVEAWITSDATDAVGNRLFDYQTSFRIAPDLTATAPVIVSANPANTSGEPLNTVATVRFSKPLNPATVSASTAYILRCGDAAIPIPATLSLHNGNTVVRITPNAPLATGSCGYYYYYLSAGLRDVNGLAFAGAQYYFYVSGTTDSVVPSVAHVAPANNAVNVPLNAVIRLTFNRTIETPTVDPQTVTLKLGATPIPYTVVSTTNNDDSFAIVLRPAGVLPANATIQVGVTNGVKDDAGHAATPFSSSFTTSSTPDFSTPLVVATTTINGATNVPLTSVYTVTFDRPMNTRSFKLGANIYLQDNFTGAVVPSTMSFSGDLTQVTLAPLATLAVNRNYSAVWAGQLDFAENSAGFDSRQFTTALQAPIGGPVVVLHTPQTGDTNVPVNFMPAIRFDRPVMRTSVTAITFTRSGVPVPYVPSFESGDTFVRLVPSAILQPNSSYVLTITGVKDTGGTAMAGSTAVTFTTGPTIDLISPVTLASSPENNRITGTNPVIRFRVNEPIDPLRSTGAYLQNVVSGRLVNGFSTVFSADRRMITITYPGSLDRTTRYRACAPNLFDLAANYGGTPCVEFLTALADDLTQPVVSSVTPPAGAVGVPLNAKIVVRMSEAMDLTSLTTGVMTLTPAVAGTVQIATDGLTITFQPAGSLAPATNYVLDVNGFRDLSGNPMAAFSSGFATGGAADTANGTVTLTNPLPAATGVSTTTTITLTLSKPVNVAQLVSDAFQVHANGGGIAARIPGTIAVGAGGTTLTFTPSNPLPPNVTITVYASYYVAIFDLAGNYYQSIANSFTTGAGPDATAPTVVSITPVNGATNLGPSTVVTFMFSEPLNPSTITAANFALYNGYLNVTSGVSYSADLRMVTMTGNLPYGSIITVLAGTGVRDLNGNPLATTFRSTFSLLPALLAASPTVTQVRPAQGASNVPKSSVITLYTSNPLLASSIAGGLFVSQNGVLITGTTVLRSGGRSVVFTPQQPFQPGARVQVFLTSAARDTAGTPFVDFAAAFTVDPDLGGGPLQVSSATPLQSSGNPRNSVVDLRFNKALDPSYVNGTYFSLTDSTNAVVATTATLILPNVVRITPTATLGANTYFYYHVAAGLRAADASTLAASYDQYFYTGAVVDSVLPAFTSIAPVNGATGVGDNAVIRFAFNKLMADATLNPSMITLQSGGVSQPFGLSFSSNGVGTTIALTPQAPLPNNAQATLTLSAGITDRVGHPITPLSVTFTVGGGPDMTPPVVVRRSPDPSQGTGVPTNTTTFTWVFDEALEPGWVTPASYLVQRHSDGVYLPTTVTLAADGRTVNVSLASNLLPNTGYSVCAYNNYDLVGNSTSFGCYSFTSGAGAAAAAPQIIGVTPVANSTGVAVNVLIEVAFDSFISATSLDQIAITAGATPVPFTVSIPNTGGPLAGRVIRLVPSVLLNPNTLHTVNVQGVRDVTGQTVVAPYVFNFTTGQDYGYSTTTLTAATVLSAGVETPLVNGQTITGVSPITTVKVTFSSPVSFSSAVNDGVGIRVAATGTLVPVSVTLSPDGKTVTLTPTPPLSVGTQYFVHVNYYVALFNQAGYQISGNACCMNFTTGAPNLARSRTGTTNPTASGFVAVGAPTGSAVVNDGGFDAWLVTGSSGGDGYGSQLTEPEKVAAYSKGWRLTAVLRAVSGSGFANVDFGSGRRRFDINFTKTAGGDTLVKLNTAIPVPGNAPQYLVPGTGYHTYELVFDPLSQKATLFIDGVPRLSGYAGHTDFITNAGPWFGAVSGTFHHSVTRFEIMP